MLCDPQRDTRGFIIESYKLCYLDEVSCCPQFLMKEKLLNAVSENYQRVVGFENVAFLTDETADETLILRCSFSIFSFSHLLLTKRNILQHS